jgi:PAS domain S-box-containing protein
MKPEETPAPWSLTEREAPHPLDHGPATMLASQGAKGEGAGMPVDGVQATARTGSCSDQATSGPQDRTAELERRVAELEAENQRLREALATPAGPRDENDLVEFLVSTPLPVAVMRGGHVVRASAAFASALGLTLEELGTIAVAELIPEASRSALLERVVRAERGAFNPPVQVRLRRRDGGWATFLSVSFPISLGGQAAALAVGIDLSERIASEERVAASEERLQRVLNTLPDVAYVLDLEARQVEFVSQRAGELLGWSIDELLRLEGGAFNLIHPEDLRVVATLTDQANASPPGGIVEFEVRARAKDGQFRHLRARETCFDRNPDGTVRRILGSVRDVTDERRTQEALARSEAQYRALVENLPDIVSRMDVEGRCLFVNQRIEDYSPHQRRDVIGKTPAELGYPPREAAQFVDEIATVIRTGEPHHREFVNPTPDGLRVFEQRLIPELDPAGRVASVLAVGRDVTAQRRVEQEYRGLFEGLADAFVVVEPLRSEGEVVDFRVALANSQFFCLLERSGDDVVGKTATELLPTLRDFFVSLIARVATTRKPEEFSAYSAHYAKHLEGFAFATDFARCACIVRDVTERRAAERELVESREQLRALAVQISAVEERERRKLAAFLHDQVGQALALLRIRLGPLASAADPQTRTLVEEMRSLLSTTLEQTQNLTFDLSPPILYELGIEAAIEWFGERLAEQHGFAFAFAVDGQQSELPHPAHVVLFRVVRELLINVVKHASAQHVSVRVEWLEEQLKIRVEDDGVGLPAAHEGWRRCGFGLLSVREHMRSLGGQFELGPVSASAGETRSAHGTVALLLMPLASAPRSGDALGPGLPRSGGL